MVSDPLLILRRSVRCPGAHPHRCLLGRCMWRQWRGPSRLRCAYLTGAQKPVPVRTPLLISRGGAHGVSAWAYRCLLGRYMWRQWCGLSRLRCADLTGAQNPVPVRSPLLISRGGAHGAGAWAHRCLLGRSSWCPCRRIRSLRCADLTGAQKPVPVRAPLLIFRGGVRGSKHDASA